MRTLLAFWNLWHRKWRSLMAIVGVAFAILLVFMQLGFLHSAELSATCVYDALDYDLLVRSRDYLCLTSARGFPRYRLEEALGHAEVAGVSPVFIQWQAWRDPVGQMDSSDTEKHNYRRAILVLGFNLKHRIFKHSLPNAEPPTDDKVQRLSEPNSVLVDTYTRPYFGIRGKGTETELNGNAIRVVGEFAIGTGLGADGLVVTSDRTFASLTSARALDWPTLGLIKLKSEPREPVNDIKRELNSLFASRGDVEVLTRDEVNVEERKYWLKRTPVGVIFWMGAAVAFAVGAVFVYQVMATDIADRSSEYATLKAMGYGRWYLWGIVLQQATAYAVLGYVPGYLVALLLYWLGRRYQQILLFQTWERNVLVLVLSIFMCSVSGVIAIRKVNAADPADLF